MPATDLQIIRLKVDIDRDEKTSNTFRVRLLPDTWFIAENTEIIGHRPGYISPEQLKRILKMLLDKDIGQ